jgi:membrane-bound metal-dependent hydrolase YbcI (DUF457 family)
MASARYCIFIQLFDSPIPGPLHTHSIPIMASNKAHHASGWAAGVVAAALVFDAGAAGPYQAATVLALLGGALGGTAPDWLELAWWSRRRRLWITHRTLTHWGLPWCALLAYAYLELGRHFWAAPLFGFAAGGVTHLLADWPNPLGVPWIVRRHSLNLWRSGHCDLLVIGAAWAIALAVGDHVFFADIHALKAFAFVKSLPVWSWRTGAA